jgi:CheY-like chemotaxis protein
MLENTGAILLVDDNANDAELFCEALKHASFSNRVIVLKSGEEALRYVKTEGRYSNREEFPMPRLVLLDNKMPGIAGVELLAWLRLRDDLLTKLETSKSKASGSRKRQQVRMPVPEKMGGRVDGFRSERT